MAKKRERVYLVTQEDDYRAMPVAAFSTRRKALGLANLVQDAGLQEFELDVPLSLWVLAGVDLAVEDGAVRDSWAMCAQYDKKEHAPKLKSSKEGREWIQAYGPSRRDAVRVAGVFRDALLAKRQGKDK